jgi:hypothetical protein
MSCRGISRQVEAVTRRESDRLGKSLQRGAGPGSQSEASAEDPLSDTDDSATD